MKKTKYLLVLLIFSFSFINIKAAEKSIVDYSYGISGKVSIPSIKVKMNNNDNQDTLISATSTGIYIIKDNDYIHIDTKASPIGMTAVDDIDGDGTKDIIYMVNNVGDFYNLIAVSGNDGKIIWKNKVSEYTFNYNAGFFTNNNNNLYKMKKVGNDIAIIYDYTIEVFDYKNGKTIYKYIDKDNIWDVTTIADINNNQGVDLVVSNQLGEVKAIDGKTGKVLWSNKVIPDLTVKKNKVNSKVTRNVWQVMYHNDLLYAMGEDGTLYNLDLKTGQTLKSINIFKFESDLLNKFYTTELYGSSAIYPIGKNSIYFHDFEMFPMSGNRVIISAFVNQGVNNYGINPGVKLYGGAPFLVTVDLNEMKELYKISLNELELTNVAPLELENEQLITIPTQIKNGQLIVNAYNTENGEKVKSQEFYIGTEQSASSIKSIYTSHFNNNILLEGHNGFSIFVDTKLNTIVKNNDNYVDSKILLQENSELVLSYKLNNKIERIVKYQDLTKKEIAWEYIVTRDFNNDGLSSITITHDFNKDGIKDLTALVNKKDDNNNTIASYLLILDMKTGQPISFKSIFLHSYYESNKKIDVYLTGSNIYAINDINGNKVPDLVVDNNVINGSNLKVIGSVNESLDSSGRALKIGDINNDGFNDFVAIEDKVATIHLSKKSDNNIFYTKTNIKYTYDKELLNHEMAVFIPDLNNDGISELVFNAKNDNGKQYYKVLSGSNLQPLFNILEEGISTNYNNFFFLNFDIDNDGYNDFVERKNWDTVYHFISGKTGQSIMEINISPYGEVYDRNIKEEIKSIIPFTVYDPDFSLILGEDYNDDSHPELLFLKETYYPKQESVLQIYDAYAKNNTPIKEVVISSTENKNYYYYDGYVEQNKLITKVINADNLYVIKPSAGNNIIYDIKNEQIIAGFETAITKAIKMSDNLLFAVNSNNSPININYANDFNITNVANKSVVNSPLKIKWNYEDYGGMNIVKIYDNGTYIATSYTDNIELLLKAGNHKLTFESIDHWGKILSGSLDVTVVKTNNLVGMYLVLSIGLIIIIAGISFGPKIRRNMVLRRFGK